jgi:YaaC-like Protein
MSRHAPPGYAGRGNRKAVYSAAMEQAEQFLTASENIGYEIKPILLYYGFNQMLRASRRSATSRGIPGRSRIMA